MKYKAQDKFIITGLPRTGTTMMMAVFSKLGLDIDYPKKEVDEAMAENKGALEYVRDNHAVFRRERNRGIDNSPTIIKHPSFGEHYILPLARNYDWNVKHVFVTSRELEPFLKSHIKRKKLLKKNPDVDKLKHELTQTYYENMKTILYDIDKHRYPYSFIEFPKLVTNWRYAYRNFRPMLDALKVSKWAFHEAWSRTYDESMVHFK